jgi:hypothetical protein
MITSKLRASSLLAALSIALFGVAAHAGGPAGRKLPSGPVTIGQSNVVLGWPHDPKNATPLAACRAAGPNEVVIQAANGVCFSLAPGFYSTVNYVSNTWAVLNISVGSGVRARAFFLEHYSQDQDHPFIIYAPTINLPLNTAAQTTIRSMRVEPANRSMTCNDVVPGEIALFEGWDGGGDCVVLPVGPYPNADAMGIANDSISGVNNQTSVKATLFWNANFDKQGAVIAGHTNLPRLPQGGHFSDTIDNQASSMQMQ